MCRASCDEHVLRSESARHDVPGGAARASQLTSRIRQMPDGLFQQGKINLFRSAILRNAPRVHCQSYIIMPCASSTLKVPLLHFGQWLKPGPSLSGAFGRSGMNGLEQSGHL